MDNKTIAKNFDLLAKLMELHQENPFKIRTYSNAYQKLRRIDLDLKALSKEELMKEDGIGNAVSSKIIELLETGSISALEKIRELTPAGVEEILDLKGLGPKKVRLLWKELGLESLGEVEYACHENRLLSLKGFGKKTQESILDQIAFKKRNIGKILLSKALDFAEQIIDLLTKEHPTEKFEITGSLRRKIEVIDCIEILSTLDRNTALSSLPELGQVDEDGEVKLHGVAIKIIECTMMDFAKVLFETTGPKSFISQFQLIDVADEIDLFTKANIGFIVPELRDLSDDDTFLAPSGLIELSDVKGIFHAHSTWSDGANSIEQMAEACISDGYEYLVLTDHSKSAFYANGLTEERVWQQWEEIDLINKKHPDFRVLKGIESDILFNGALDYENDLLAKFELIIASIHSNLKMNEEKATERLIAAIENPYTKVLGHMTGRLLLSRPGYPVDSKKIIDACSSNGVAIEINSNPHRLDLDWRLLPYALKKGVKIVLSPDAHNVNGIKDVEYGVMMAKKGGVTKEVCVNTYSMEKLHDWMKE